jgi:uncharacterized protein YyaL (SSP411 family)
LSNRLSGETSPYLLQHAENPVDWYPWGPEALDRAKAEDRPILLSIGYSSCHWCHVMAHESFEDDETAALMNDTFVNIKVDREERPDVDAVYMRAVQALTGQGGWPLTVFLTPSGEPYYGGTYFPPRPRHGMPAFRQVLRAVGDAWVDRREEVAGTARELRRLLEKSTTAAPGDGNALHSPAAITRHGYRFLAGRYDSVYGGFGAAPKFPQPVTLEFLLRWQRTAEDAGEAEHASEIVISTLRHMARGGMRDHLGGGFHRYSVDERWLVPHFEKMLYDNALLARLCVQAWQVSRDPELLDAATTTFAWILSDMRHPQGGFFSARDADSEGVEGRHYVWTLDELHEVLGTRRATRFARVYGVTARGNFDGRNILHLREGLETVARREGLPLEKLLAALANDREALLEARSRRTPPLRDEKILAAWNGLTIRALAEAGGALGRDDWTEAAVTALDFVLGAMRRDRDLLRTWTAGEARIPGFLEDYGAIGNALVTVWEVTLDPRWLPEIRWAAESILDRFREPETGLLFDTAADAERLVVRPRDVMDNAIPSGTSLAAELLLRAGHLLGEGDWSKVGRDAIQRDAAALERFPSAFGRMLSLMVGEARPWVEVALVGGLDTPQGRALRSAVLSRYLPDRTIAGRNEGGKLPEPVPLLDERGTIDGQPTAYVCRNFVCEPPVTAVEALGRSLDEASAGGRSA